MMLAQFRGRKNWTSVRSPPYFSHGTKIAPSKNHQFQVATNTPKVALLFGPPYCAPSRTAHISLTVTLPIRKTPTHQPGQRSTLP